MKGRVDDKARVDSLRGDVCTIACARRTERVQGTVVYLCVPFPHTVFVYYSYQVCLSEYRFPLKYNTHPKILAYE